MHQKRSINRNDLFDEFQRCDQGERVLRADIVLLSCSVSRSFSEGWQSLVRFVAPDVIPVSCDQPVNPIADEAGKDDACICKTPEAVSILKDI